MIQYVDKDKYKITVDCGYIDGKRKRISRTIIGSKTDAKRKEVELIESIKNGNYTINKNITLKELSDMYIEDYCNHFLKENTTSHYKGLLKLIHKELGNLKVESIKPYTLQKFYNKLDSEFHYSDCTRRHYYVLLNSIFEQGIKWQVITNNPNKGIIKPKIATKDVNIYNNEQVSKLLNCLEKEHIRHSSLIILALDSGMRREELNGLKWENIDLDNGIIHINKVRIYVDGKIIEETPKTAQSQRYIVVSEYSLKYLKRLKEYQDNIKKDLGHTWNNENYVFVNDDGKAYFPGTPSKILKRILKKYNLEYITFHQLRHTSATLLINNNTDINTVSARLGHADKSTTLNIYSHAFEQSKKEAANKMNDILNKL